MMAASAAQALTVVPTDLNPGQQYRLVFVTDGRRNAISPNIADYNNFVTDNVIGSQLEMDLADAGLTTDWFAIGSTASTSARNNTSTNGVGVPIYLITGERVADDYLDLWDGDIQTAIDTTPNEIELDSDRIWTGSSDDGEIPVGAFLGDDLFFVSEVGDLSQLDRWIGGFTQDSTAVENRLYGMSSVLEVPQAQSTPEPSSLLGFVTLGGLMLGGAIRHIKK